MFKHTSARLVQAAHCTRFFFLLALSLLVQNGWAAAPTITSFSPGVGPITTTVTITGMNFSTTKPNNLVKFNGTTATVSTATATTLVVLVPTGAVSGIITVTVGGMTVTSSTSFIVTTPSGSPSVSPVGGPA